ncbi:MAG: DUF1190 domain-containing protein, partial [Beijerinckiaceae bacterium]|nr:DUF1190 domain-containing protein [Beijerinckiaceae bacterium]
MANESTSVPPRSNFGMRGIDTPTVDAMGRKSTWRKSSPVKADAGEAKRSAAMTLVAIGAGAFGLWAFASTGSVKDAHGKIYSSSQECASDGAVGQSNCTRLWQEAVRLQSKNSPVQATLAKCEELYG